MQIICLFSPPSVSFFKNWGIISCSETHTFYRSAYHKYVHTYADLRSHHWNQERERFRYPRKFCRAPFQAVGTHRGPAGPLPITADAIASSGTSSVGTAEHSVLAFGTWLLSLSMKPRCSPSQQIIPSDFWERVCGMNIPQFVDPFCWQTLGLFPALGYHEWIFFEHSCCIHVFWTPTLPPPREEFLGHSVGYDSFHCHMIFFFLASSLFLFVFLHSTL